MLQVIQERSQDRARASFQNTPIDMLALQGIPEGTLASKQCNEKECRICLESQHSDDNQLIAPCNCTGSVQYIHVSCFQTWIKKKSQDPKFKQELLGKTGIVCQICRQRFQYSCSTDNKCSSSEIICKRVRSHLTLCLVFLIFFLFDISLLSVVIWFAITDTQNADYDIREPRYFSIYLSMVFCVLTLYYGFYNFVNFYFVEVKFEIVPENKIKMVPIRARLSEAKKLMEQGELQSSNSYLIVVKGGNRVSNL